MIRFAKLFTLEATDKHISIPSNHLVRLKARRKIWLKIHLWLGLIFGLFLAISGLTGSILVFYDEIDEWLNHDLLIVDPANKKPSVIRPLSEILSAGNRAIPDDYVLHMVSYPSSEAANFKLFYHLRKKAEDKPDIAQVLVDPYNALAVGKRLLNTNEKTDPASYSAFITLIFRLHYELICGATGKLVVGIFASFLIFSVLTGLILWWPLTNQWHRVLTIKQHASKERLNHDLHQITGFYLCPVLLTLFISGIYMNLPEPFLALTRLLSPGTRGYMEFPQSSAPDGRKPIGIEQALIVALSHYPEGKISMLGSPMNDRGNYTVIMKEVPNISNFRSERQIAVDQYNGTILGVRSPDIRLTAGETFLDWQWPLHSGKAFGWPGRILICLTGLACPLLFVTGLIRWLQKRRTTRVSARRKALLQKYTNS